MADNIYLLVSLVFTMVLILLFIDFKFVLCVTFRKERLRKECTYSKHICIKHPEEKLFTVLFFNLYTQQIKHGRFNCGNSFNNVKEYMTRSES